MQKDQTQMACFNHPRIERWFQNPDFKLVCPLCQTKEFSLVLPCSKVDGIEMARAAKQVTLFIDLQASLSEQPEQPISMNQKETDITVTLIDYTGIGSSDPWYAARLLIYTKNTRLEQGLATRVMVREMIQEDMLKELDYISKTIRSSWEFVDYTFEIRNVTRAFTHQLVRTRTASYAQQAQRVVDMSDFKTRVPVSVYDCGVEDQWAWLMRQIKDIYQFMKVKGVPAQDLRGILPTNVHTNIIAKMNLRTLADLVGKRDNLRAQGEYIEVIRDHIVPLVLAIHPWTRPFLYPERTATPNIEALLTDLLGNAGPLDKPKINAALKELDALKAVWG